MIVDVAREGQWSLAEYARVSIAFEVREVFEVSRASGDPNDIRLTPHRIAPPYVKDYDASGEDGPARWTSRFDLSHWAIFVARIGGTAVGGAAVIFGAPDVEMLAGRRDVAMLWDIRVAPEARGSGVGTNLLRAAESWAVAQGARGLEVETQNINVPACRFYERHGFMLRAANPLAYPDLPEEIQLLWRKRLR